MRSFDFAFIVVGTTVIITVLVLIGIDIISLFVVTVGVSKSFLNMKTLKVYDYIVFVHNKEQESPTLFMHTSIILMNPVITLIQLL